MGTAPIVPTLTTPEIHYLFRFRDLVAPTLHEHQQIIDSQGSCWWGWWKRPSESNRIDVWGSLQAEITVHREVPVGLFDSGSGRVHKAWINQVILPDDGVPDGRVSVFCGALNAKILIGFLKRLVHGREKRVFVILDNLRVHHSKVLKKWLQENEEKIAVFYLPSYSPELNPDELLNADLKQRVTKVTPARNKLVLTRTAIGALRSIQKQPKRVESYFG